MCGVVGIVGPGGSDRALHAAMEAIAHRGPDDRGEFTDPAAGVWLGHLRLSILDLSPVGRQPMSSPDGRFHLVLNGEIYNYKELRQELSTRRFDTGTDSEVLLAAYERWGSDCLDRLIGMFTFLVWDSADRSLFVARDRFGVKPCYYSSLPDRSLAIASEIKALHALGLRREPDERTWAGYLVLGAHDVGDCTFWAGVRRLEAGHFLKWKDGDHSIARWYDLAQSVGPEPDVRPDDVVADEYVATLRNSIDLRFRADVPVGINLSGGLDSSALLAGVHAAQGEDSDVRAFTFVTGDDRYDELPWVDQMLAHTSHPSTVVRLDPASVPELALSVQTAQDEPYGGLPTLAYAALFDAAAAEGVTVLLDGQGMDEQWAGYDYYRSLGARSGNVVQGTASSPVRPSCLSPEFLELATAAPRKEPFEDALQNAQLHDIEVSKLPRSLRFNDRVSMRTGRELREPFLDHRLVELAVRQPRERKVDVSTGKVFLRRMLGRELPARVVHSPKRPVQTPQREWLRGPLRDWVESSVDAMLRGPFASWFDANGVRDELGLFQQTEADNSFFVWQWLSVAMAAEAGAVSV